MFFIIIFFFVFISCSSEKDDGGQVFARVGEKKLTKKDVIDMKKVGLVNEESISNLVNNWVKKTLLYNAAINTSLDKDIVLETCPTSNIATKIYENYETHPVKKLHDLGVRVTVNSDDPPFFNATIQGEYEAMKGIGFSENELVSMTRNAIESSFLEEEKKNKILVKLD